MILKVLCSVISKLLVCAYFNPMPNIFMYCQKSVIPSPPHTWNTTLSNINIPIIFLGLSSQFWWTSWRGLPVFNGESVRGARATITWGWCQAGHLIIRVTEWNTEIYRCYCCLGIRVRSTCDHLRKKNIFCLNKHPYLC